MTRRIRPLLLVPIGLLGLAGAAWPATAGCSPGACVPRTGTWTAPSPQKLTYFGNPAPLELTIGYRRNGKLVKSRYGNSVESFGVYLRYFCADPHAPWVETGFGITEPVPVKRDGTVKVTLPANYAHRAHTLRLKFTRTTFSGRLSGTATGYEGQVCSTSVSFSGKLKP